MTRWSWRQVGGTLVEEFVAVRRSGGRGARLLDGVIVKDGEHRIARHSEVSPKNKDVIVVQTKARRLGMNLRGQAFFSARLVRAFGPRSVVPVALRNRDDSALRPLIEQYPGMRVVVCPPPHKSPTQRTG